MEIREFNSSKMSVLFGKYLERHKKTLMGFIHEICGKVSSYNLTNHCELNDEEVFDFVNEFFIPHSECNAHDIYDVIFPGVCKEMKIVDSNPEETKRTKEKLKKYINVSEKKEYIKPVKRQITVNNHIYEHEISSEVMDVINNQGKTIDYYVDKITNDVINNCIYDLSKIGDFYPKEFDCCFYYNTRKTFEPLIHEKIDKLQTFKARLYKTAKDYLEHIGAIAYDIELASGELEDNDSLNDAIDSIYVAIDRIEGYRDAITLINKVLSSTEYDETKTIKLEITPASTEIFANSNFLLVDLTGKYKKCYFEWPVKMFDNYENHKADKYILELPENLKVEISGKKETVEITALELKKYIQ